MPALPWITYSERVVGRNHPTFTDVANRPLRELLTQSGYNPDATNVMLPSFSKTVNVGSNAFSGTAEVRLTAAIALAVTLGWTWVFVPAKAWDGTVMLPYNANLVTFNNAVTMIAEGENPSTFNIRAYGAAGDGVQDDTVAIQAAINAAKSTDAGSTITAHGSTVEMPIGIYKITATIDTFRSMVIRGEGWGTVLRSTVANPIIRMRGDAIDNEVRGLIWQNFVVDGVSTANGLTGGYSTRFGDGGTPTSRTSVIAQCRFINCSVGLRLVATQGLFIRDCKFDYNLTGCYISDNAQIGTFDCCDFRANTTVGLLMEASNAVIGGVNDIIYNWTMKDCHFESNMGKGCIMDGCSTNTFINSKWEQNTGTFLTLQKVNGGGFENTNNSFIGGTWNGNPGTPTVLQLDLQSGKGNIFMGCGFNSASNGGINIASGGWRSQFINCNLASTITDNAAASVGTTYLSPLSGRVAIERTVFAMTDAATIAVDTSKGDVQAVTLGGNRTLGTPTSTRSGQQVTLFFTQDGTGGRNLSVGFTVLGSTISGTGNLPNTTATWTIAWDGTNWRQVAFVPYSNTLTVSSLIVARATKTTTYTITAIDSTIFADATGGVFTVTLPNATFFPGIIFTVKKVDASANAVTVAGGGLNIDGVANKSLPAQYNSITVQSDGANWQVIAANPLTLF
jgi:hypothetical protein